MKSMTGFSFIETAPGGGESYTFQVDIKSYNNRYRDLSLNLPSLLNPLEPEIREMCSQAVRRGRLELSVRYHEVKTALDVHVDPEAARRYTNALEELVRTLNLKDSVSLSHLLPLEGVLAAERRADTDQIRSLLLPLIEKGLAEMDASRRVEGERTARDIAEQLTVIRRQLALFRQRAPEAEDQIKKGLRERFAEVMGDEAEDNRIMAETAVLLVRYSISEEIARLTSHLESFEEMAAHPGAVGKKLDFLCQEIGREINTIGSKTQMVDVQQGVVLAKDALENVREQLRNVE